MKFCSIIILSQIGRVYGAPYRHKRREVYGAPFFFFRRSVENEKVGKAFKTIEEQIKILQSRNLIIDDFDEAAEFLFYENYYKVINGYKEIFIEKDNGKELFKPGTRFDDIKNLYLFDRELKKIFLDKILDIEARIKTLIAYKFSEEYCEDFNYLNLKNYNCRNYQKTLKVINEIINIIYHRVKNEQDPIGHYLKTYNNIPLWVLINYFTIGNLNKFYDVLTDSLKNKISKIIGDNYKENYASNMHDDEKKIRFNENYINDFLRITNIIRNICAHHEILFNLTIKTLTKWKDLLKIRPSTFKNETTISLFIFFLSYFDNRKEFATFITNINTLLAKYQNMINEDSFKLVVEKMGYNPEDYAFVYVSETN